MSELADKEILFVLGSGRSGTTFLNGYLDRWFDYGMGPEGTFVKLFHDRLPRYGDLSKRQNLARLVEDISRCQMLEIMRKRYRGSNRLDVTPEQIHAQVLEPTYAGVVYAVFQCLAVLRGKKRVGNKNPSYWNHLALLDKLFPEQAKYISIVRDGRDVFLSLQGVPWGRLSAYAAAKRWCQAQNAIELFQERCGSGRFLLLRYEDLLRSPAQSIARIEEFLGVELAPETRALALSEAQSNPKKNNFYKWRDRLLENDRRIFESVAGDVLTKHGYETLPNRPRISLLQKRYFDVVELMRIIWVNVYHMQNKLPGDIKGKTHKIDAGP